MKQSYMAWLSLGLAACAGREAPGVDLLLPIPTWTVDAEPVRVIGDTGAPATQFLQVVPARLPHGELLAADIGSLELRVFQGANLVARLGRVGRGPGEFTERFIPAISGDTIFAIGSRNLVRVYTPRKGFLREFRLRGPASRPRFIAVGRLEGGGYLVEEGPGFKALSTVPSPDRLVPDSVTLGLLLAAPESAARAYVPLGRFERGRLVPHAWPGGPMATALSRSPFQIGALWAVAGNQVWIADAATGIVTQVDASGAVLSLDTLPIARRQFHAPAMDHARDRALTSATDDYLRASLEAIYRPEMRPAWMPVFDQVLPGLDGELWVRLFEVEPGPTRRFLVIGATGEPKATVSLPAEVTLHQVGVDYLLGVRRDTEGVETIVEYRLDRAQ